MIEWPQIKGHDMTAEEDTTLIELTAVVVAAYVSNNPVPAGDLPALIADVYSALGRARAPAAQPVPELKPAVNPKKSVFPDYIINLEDGKRYKSLKRNLATRHGLTPAEYRVKWGLPPDYPMVAPNYAAVRSALAKSSGLGRKKAEPVPAPAPKKRGRAAKARTAE
jgi:predicted transcriptional regulator